MRPDGPKSWLLDGRAGWRTGDSERTVAAGLAGIRLAPRPGGPYALDSEGGSLGGLRSPLVLGNDRFLLARERREVLRYVAPKAIAAAPAEGARGAGAAPAGAASGAHAAGAAPAGAARGAFVALPDLGGAATGARALVDPAAIAVAGRTLYIADPGARRVLVVALDDLALRAVWGPWDAVSLVAAGGRVYVLDRAAGRVWRHHPAAPRPALVLDRPDAADRWSNLAVDRAGRIYLHDAGAARLDVSDGTTVTAPAAVRDRFDAPPLLIAGGRLELDGAVFDTEGRPVADDPARRGPLAFERDGTWRSEPLDSEIAGCQWHRVELELGGLPTGSEIELRTYADDRLLADVDTLPDGVWETRRVLTGALQPGGAQPAGDEFLVQSRPGRYLWLRVALRGDGTSTPAITGLRVHYPRASYLEHLPELFSADDETRWFLERFLSIAQTEWDDIQRRGEELPAAFDPDAVPAGEPLERLARWLALDLEQRWDDAGKRRLLAGAPPLASKRGTLEAVRGFLRLYLEALRGADTGGHASYPCVVEGFRERARLLLSTGAPAALGHGAPLWSRDVVGRLQIGVHSRVGDARMVSVGDPQRDLFGEHAHRFRVYVPAAWVRSADEERMVRRALDAEKPAHTQYDLCLVEPRLRVGVQCTVGVDAIVAGVPVWRLACEPPGDAPPSRAPSGRLGHDTVLSSTRESGLRVGERLDTYQPLI